jgi:acetyltransferase-like isoleucine patch superfamily enzyme
MASCGLKWWAHGPITKQGLSRQGITVEDDVWFGAGVRVLDGVTIGKGPWLPPLRS